MVEDTASILVVDDEESVRRVITRLLETQGYQVVSAACFKDALNLMKDETFDILLTDHLMEGGTGLELIVEANKLYPDVVKLLLTGYGDRELYLDAINKGAVFSVIEKPSEARQIIEKIAQAVEYRDRRRRELREFEKLKKEHHDLFATTTDLIICVDSEGRFIYVNPAWHATLGYTEEDFFRMTFTDCLAEQYRDFFRALMVTIREGASVQPFETVMIASDGGELYFEGNVMSSYIEKAIMTVTFVMRDVTERKRATEEIQSRLRQETMIARITELIARADEPAMVYQDIIAIIGRDVDCGRAYLYGFDEESRTMRRLACWRSSSIGEEHVCPETIPFDKVGDLYDSIHAGRPFLYPFAGESGCDEPEFFELYGVKSLLAMPLGIGTGVVGLLGFDTVEETREWDEKELNMLRAVSHIIANAWNRQLEIDIRKQKEAEAEESRLLVIRADRLAAMGTMSAGIIHEITQPLNAINVSTQTIMYGLKHGWSLEQEQVQKSLTLITEQVGRMTDIITNMRAFAREGLPASRESAGLNSQVERVFTLLGQQLKAHDIEVDTDFGSIPPTAMNTNLIFQVIVNLITNARQALDDFDGEEKRITVRTFSDDGLVCLEVADNGPGISDDLADKIFDPFFTTKEVGQGTGLGLSISAGIVQDHSGQLLYRRGDDGGAVFIMRLPVTGTGKENDA